MNRMFRVFKETRGVALVEFAICLPFILMMMTGGIELGNSILVHIRLERSARNLADMIARRAGDFEGLSERELNDMLLITRKGSGEDLDVDSRIIVTTLLGQDLDSDGNAEKNVIAWQRFGGSYIAAPLILGCWNNMPNPVLAKDRQLSAGETLFHVQITKKYDPLMRVLFDAMGVPTSYTRSAAFRGRGSIYRNLLTSPGVEPHNTCAKVYMA